MIGQSHLEQLGTRENILKAKMEICLGMPDGAPLVLNADNDLLCTARVPARLRRVTFAMENPDADVRAADVRAEAGGHVVHDRRPRARALCGVHPRGGRAQCDGPR